MVFRRMFFVINYGRLTIDVGHLLAMIFGVLVLLMMAREMILSNGLEYTPFVY